MLATTHGASVTGAVKRTKHGETVGTEPEENDAGIASRPSCLPRPSPRFAARAGTCVARVDATVSGTTIGATTTFQIT
jgi:hypothetical protein